MKIRPYHATDATHLTALYRRSVQILGARDDTPAQVRVWAELAPSPERLQVLARDGRIRLVAVDGHDQPITFCDLESDGHIHLFYCAPEAAGTGVAAELYDAVEKAAFERGISRLSAEASEAAWRFFLKQGFRVTARRDFEVAGVPIHNYAIEKELDGGSQATMPA